MPRYTLRRRRRRRHRDISEKRQRTWVARLGAYYNIIYNIRARRRRCSILLYFCLVNNNNNKKKVSVRPWWNICGRAQPGTRVVPPDGEAILIYGRLYRHGILSPVPARRRRARRPRLFFYVHLKGDIIVYVCARVPIQRIRISYVYCVGIYTTPCRSLIPQGRNAQWYMVWCVNRVLLRVSAYHINI